MLVVLRVRPAAGDGLTPVGGKKINGRKRFIVAGTLGLLIVVVVLAASVQDGDGAKTTLLSAYLTGPIRFVFADGGLAG